jgi:hypothetical protein
MEIVPPLDGTGCFQTHPNAWQNGAKWLAILAKYDISQ